MIKSMMRAGAAGAALLLGACATMPVPQYTASFENVKKLKDAGMEPVALEKFAAGPQAHDKGISIRGNKAVSPTGNGFADYVRDALEQELRRAELMAPAAPRKITATLVENDMDVPSGTATARIALEVAVTEGGSPRFRKVIRATTSWESSFVGAVAIPRAVQAYPKLVETLLASLYADAEFIAAVKAPAPAPAGSP